jgi:phage-related holin
MFDNQAEMVNFKKIQIIARSKISIFKNFATIGLKLSKNLKNRKKKKQQLYNAFAQSSFFCFAKLFYS